MEPDRDRRLTELLKTWKVTDAPRSLDERVLAIPQKGWRFWLTGAVRVPVPMAFAALVLLAVLTVLLVREPAREVPAAPEFNLSDFQPVETVKVQIIEQGRRPEDAR
jgi:hypothetical protein